MNRKEIIDGLKFTVEMFLFDATTGETKTKNMLNDMDLITVNDCEGAIEILENIEKVKCKIQKLQNANPSYWHSGDMVEREEVLDLMDEYLGA